MIAIDTETTLINPITRPVPALVSVAIAVDGASCEVVHHTDPALPGLLADCLSGPTAWCAAPFDFAAIVEALPSLEPTFWASLDQDPSMTFRSPGLVLDVATREKLLDLAAGRGLRRKYGLGRIARDRTGMELDKADPWRKRYGELLRVPVEQWPADAIHYAWRDGVATWAVAAAQETARRAFTAEHGLDPLADAARQARGHWALYLSSLHGVRTDPVAVAALDERLSDELARCKQHLVQVGLVRENGVRDTKKVQALGEACGIVDRTPTGQVSVDEETLAKLDLPKCWAGAGQLHDLAVYQRYGSILGLRSRSLVPMRQPVIRTRYSELQENGRTSAAGNELDGVRYGMNTQNLPRGDNEYERGFRECLVPREGCVFVIGDWERMELGTQGQVLVKLFGWDSPCSALARAIRDGRDPHTELGRRINSGDAKRDRQQAKPGNFGIWGGLGQTRFIAYARSQGCTVTPDQARDIYRAFYDEWHPRPYFDWVKGTAEDGIVQFLSERIRAGVSYTDACNGVWSGLAADVAKDCLWRIATEMYAPENGYPATDISGCRQVLFVHDENVLEVPRARAESAAARLQYLMEDTGNRWCPDVPLRAAVRVAERYGK